MGHNGKPPDRWTRQEWRASAETVGQMLVARWRVVAVCEKCGLRMRVSLDALVKTKGPTFSLWKKHPPCRREGCGGLVRFEGKPPGGPVMSLTCAAAEGFPRVRAQRRMTG